MRGQPASNGGLFGNTVAAPNYTGLFGNAYNFNATAAAPTRGRNTNNRGRNQVRGGTYTYRRRDDDYRPNRRWGRRYSEDSDYEGSEEEESYEESEEEEEDSDEYDREYSRLEKGTCSRYAGVTIQPVYARNMLAWKGESFCFKTLDESQLIVLNSEKETCPSTHSTRCQRSSLIFCLPSTAKCPISWLKLLHADQTETASDMTIVTNADSSLRLAYSSDSNSSAYLVGFTHSLNSLPCLDTTLSPFRINSSNSYSYPLFFKQEISCQEYGENIDAEVIDTDNEIEFYKSNQILDELRTLPMYESYAAGQKIVLVAQYTTKEKPLPSCEMCSALKPFASHGTLMKYKEFYDRYVQFLVLLDIVLFVLLVLSIKRACDRDKWTKLMNQSNHLQLVWYLFGVLFFAGQYTIVSNKFDQKKKLLLTLKDIEANDCFMNSNLNKMFDKLEGMILNHGSNYMNDGFMMQIIGIIALVMVAAAYYIFWRILSSERELEQEHKQDDSKSDSLKRNTAAIEILSSKE